MVVWNVNASYNNKIQIANLRMQKNKNKNPTMLSFHSDHATSHMNKLLT